MKVCINNSSAVKFQGRNAQIRDAQWVCHQVNARFPHFSTTKFTPAYRNFIAENFNLDSNTSKTKSFVDIEKLIIELLDNIRQNSSTTSQKQFKSNNIIRILASIQKNITQLGIARDDCSKHIDRRLEDILMPLNLVENFKLGNCYEDAKLVELVLKMNNIKNACCGILCNGKKRLDHAVCLVNPTGKIFDENNKLNKKTIIIDSWAGKTDYADNMITYYKNTFGRFLPIEENADIKVQYFDQLFLSQNDINEFREKYPNLVYKSTTRTLMEV